MATIINGIRILDKKDKTLVFKTYLLYIDWSTIPRSHGFGLMMLCDLDNEKGKFKGSTLEQDLLQNESVLKGYDGLYDALMSNVKCAKDYITKLEVSDFKNFPVTPEFQSHENLWYELDAETKLFEQEESLPQATYTMEVTDKKWLEHLDVGQVWETTTCEFHGPYWYLEHRSEKSEKFYRVYQSGAYLVTEYGRIGKGLKREKKRFDFVTAELKVKAKLRKSKGYTLIYKNFDTPFHTEKK